MGEQKAVIRRFLEADRERIRTIFRQTGQRGNPLRTYIEDEEIPARLFVDYYMDNEPQWCFVAEVEGRVVGYLLGCPDTRKYLRVTLRRTLPFILARVLWKIVTLQYRESKTYNTLWWLLTRSWRELPRFPLQRYPAHCHLHIASDYQYFQLGPKFLDVFADCLREQRIAGFHGIVLEERGKNAMAKALHMKVLATRRITVWDRCTGKQWDAKLLVRDL